MKSIFQFILILSFCVSSLSAQDSLEHKSFEELKDLFYQYRDSLGTTNELTLSAAKTVLNKAKYLDDSLLIGRGFYIMAQAHYHDNQLLLNYSDSCLLYTQNIKDNMNYPLLAYYSKAIALFGLSDYEESFNYFLKSKQLADLYNDETLILLINSNIASLKAIYGNHEEALELDLINLRLLRKKIKINGGINRSDETSSYFTSISNIIIGYLNLKKLDSANSFLKKAFKEPYQMDQDEYNEFLFLSGVVYFNRGSYHRTMDSLNKATPYFMNYNKYRIPEIYYYKGSCLKQLGEVEQAIDYFKKTDSICKSSNRTFEELRDMYQVLIDHSIASNNDADQIYYINRLLEVDSIRDSDALYLSKEITKNYDAQALLDQKNELIAKAEKKQEQTLVLGVTLPTATIGLLVFFYVRREKRIKQKFNAIITNLEQHKSGNKRLIIEDTAELSQTDLGIPNEVVESILQKLEQFEKQERFLRSDSSLITVAKYLKTNSSYLSKVVNHHKGSNFNIYISNLRVHYVLNRLNEDQRFSKYSVKAIAEEAGFNNTQSFTNTFRKLTGLKPSVYIKQLNTKD